jgi:hypothetical protein
MRAYLTGGLHGYPWWPYEAVGEDIASVWIVTTEDASGEPEPASIIPVPGMTWCGLSTLAARRRKPTATMTDRYPGMVEKVHARRSFESPNGFTFRSEWASIDIEAPTTGDFLTAIRLSRGNGNVLAMTDQAEPRSFVAVTQGIAWRATIGPLSTPSSTALDHHILNAVLTGLTMEGWLPVIPLDRHPWAGHVVIGDPRRLAAVVAALSEVTTVEPENGRIERLWRAGGGLAL